MASGNFRFLKAINSKMTLRKALGLLINFAGYPYTPSSLLPDNGLAILAASLIAQGHKVKILDYTTIDTVRRLRPRIIQKLLEHIWGKFTAKSWFSKYLAMIELFFVEFLLDYQFNKVVKEIVYEIEAEIIQNQADFVGFKLWNGDGFIGSIAIAKALRKKFPKLKIFAGGPHVDYFEEIILKQHPCFDVLIAGEGEEAINQLADYSLGLIPIDKINNAIFLSQGEIIKKPRKVVGDLNSIPFPVYDEAIYPAMKGNNKIKIFVLDESRGCPNACAFCNHPIKSGNIIRTKDVKKIIFEIKLLQEKYNAFVFRFAGSNTPWDLLEKISIEILKEKQRIIFSFFGHVRGVTEAIMEKIYSAGGRAVFFGLESGDQTILDKMHKGISIEQIISAVKAAKAAGLFTVGSLIFPAPFENFNSRQNTLELMNRIQMDSNPVLFPIIIKGTRWWKKPAEYNIRIPNEKKYLLALLNYKVKNHFPPSFWQPLPIYINGKDYHEFSRETEKFAHELEAQGRTTQIADDNFLMLKILGISITDFKKIILKNTFMGDWQSMAAMSEKINTYQIAE